jgi:hypothetical protein
MRKRLLREQAAHQHFMPWRDSADRIFWTCVHAIGYLRAVGL